MTNLRDVMVRQVSRTFALSIEVLPGVLRDSVATAYLLFRISDGIEDHAEMPVDRKVDLLQTWANILEGNQSVDQLTRSVADLDGNDPEVDVIQRAELALEWLEELPRPFQDPIRRHVYDTTLGMARWQEHGPYVADEEELDDYMHEVAGRVGYLVTDLYAVYSPAIMAVRDELMPLARECGLALQTVNVIRGIHKDRLRGWVFTPDSYIEHVGLTRDSFFDNGNQAQALKVVNQLADKADRHLRYGLDYLLTYPRTEHSIRLSLMWPFLFAVRTLAISRDNPDVLTHEAKMTRPEIKRIVASSRALGWSNTWLTAYTQKLQETPAQKLPVKWEQSSEVDVGMNTISDVLTWDERGGE